MKKLLSKTFTVKQILLLVVLIILVALGIYIACMFSAGWKKQYSGVGFRDSPYHTLIPSECRKSAARSGQEGMKFSTPVVLSSDLEQRLARDALMLEPSGYIFSFPESEKKLGFGMRGLPCMGFDFLMILHGTDFKRKDTYVNEEGEVVATITYDVIKPYKQPLPNNLWLNSWDEIKSPPQNDASLVTVEYKREGK